MTQQPRTAVKMSKAGTGNKCGEKKHLRNHAFARTRSI